MINLSNGDYYRISLMRIKRTTDNLTQTHLDRIKTEYAATCDEAGLIAGHWASDLPLPVDRHFTTIQYVEVSHD